MRNDTVPFGTVGAKATALSDAVKVTEVPAGTELPGDAEMESVGVAAAIVYGSEGETTAVKFASPE
jgi:hypothetical protein